MDLEKICDQLTYEEYFISLAKEPQKLDKEEEYPPLPIKEKKYPVKRLTLQDRKKLRKHTMEFLKNPGAKIEQWRRKLRSVYRPIEPINQEDFDLALRMWNEAILEEKPYCQIRDGERKVWKQVDKSLKYYMKIPFFLIGFDHPLKAQHGLTPEEEKQWLTVRRTINLYLYRDFWNHAVRHYSYSSPLKTFEHPIIVKLNFYISKLHDIYENHSQLVDPLWRPIVCQYPDYMTRRRSNQTDTEGYWNRSCQTWQLGPIHDGHRMIFIGRIDDQVLSSLREGAVSVSLELSQRLEWNNLIKEISTDLPKAIEISERFKRLIGDGCRFDFSNLTVDQVQSLIDQAPDPSLDGQVDKEIFDINQPINLVRRLTQDLGSTIINEWIFTDQVKQCYLYRSYPYTYHLARPIFTSHARNLIRNCCFRCGKKFSGDTERMSTPMGYNIYYQNYGYYSRYDYESVIFIFPPDQQEIGEFCDNCIDLQILEGRAI